MTDSPYRQRKWHLPNNAQLQNTDSTHARKTCLQHPAVIARSLLLLAVILRPEAWHSNDTDTDGV